MKIAKIQEDSAEKAVRMTKSRYSPQVDLVARARSTGVDEEAGRASADVNAINYPTYYIGLQVSAALDSDLWRGQIADAQVALQQAQNTTQQQRETVTNRLRDAERQVISNFDVAKSSAGIVELRTRAVRELLSAYRQGREPLVEVIRGYQDLFGAQADRARSVGNYHISLNQLAAARDELVGNVQ